MSNTRRGFVEQDILDHQNAKASGDDNDPRITLAIAARCFSDEPNRITWNVLVFAAKLMAKYEPENLSDNDAWNLFQQELRNATGL